MAPQREWFEKDYYKTLGVPESASHKEITKAYRKLARELHPDANPGDTAAEERFKEVSSAYDVLGDEAKRAEYDEVRRMGPVGGMYSGAGAPGGPGGATFTSEDLGDLGGLFSNLFGRRGGPTPGGPGPRGTGPQRGDDLQAELTMSFTDAIAGSDTTISLVSDAACHVCNGTGSRPGSAPQICPTCGGKGVKEDNQGFFSFSTPCVSCGGSGAIVVDPCANCHGSGTERRTREVKVRIPPGVSDGKTIRLKGRGGPGRNGGPPGDLFVKVHVRPDPTFGRKGNDVTVTRTISFPEAALGTKVKVPTPDGPPVTIKVPPGTQPGRVLRVRGRGVTTAKATGDLLVTVDVAVPTELSDEQRRAVEDLAAAFDGATRATTEAAS
ncbi:MAG: molecular chaperone DnaJ [Acidimicrobiia bacterium]|nr:molecular chaperone DnaJ [Acidimicrobiia bacterium]